MNRMLPRALDSKLFILNSVSPMYWPTIWLFSVRITLPPDRIPNSANTLPIISATVVFPVPGFPRNAM